MLSCNSSLYPIPYDCFKDLANHKSKEIIPEKVSIDKIEELPKSEIITKPKANISEILSRFKKIDATTILNPEDQTSMSKIMAYIAAGLAGNQYAQLLIEEPCFNPVMVAISIVAYIKFAQAVSAKNNYEGLLWNINRNERNLEKLVTNYQNTNIQNLDVQLGKLEKEILEIKNNEFCRSICQEHYENRMAFLAKLLEHNKNN